MSTNAAAINTGNRVEVASPSQDFLETAKQDLMDATKMAVVAYVGTCFLTAINPLVAGAFVGGASLASSLISRVTEKIISNELIKTIVKLALMILAFKWGASALDLSNLMIFKISISTITVSILSKAAVSIMVPEIRATC